MTIPDGQETENASITHQKALLKEYAENNGYPNLRYYVDDGYTGTNFNRPDFQRMMEDVENGIIETIVVKDMSRFGRNYILVGQYVELVLPQHHVRVIGVTDNYDSYNTENDLLVFESIFAEMYAADISKKVTYAKHTLGMNGVKLKSRPLYGYKLVDGDHNRWEIDEESAKIVRMIFDMFLYQDMSINSIAKHLRTNKVPRLLTELYEKKFQGKLSDSEFRIQSKALSCEKEKLLQFLSDATAQKTTISKKFLSVTEILNRIESYRLSELDAVTQEICDVLIEKIVIDEPMGQKEKNYGKRIVDIYIYELGNLSDLVNVRFKPYSQRIKEIAPQLLLERRCDTANVVEALATKRTSLKSALAEEGTNFQTVIVEVRKEILIDAIKKGLSIKEIYPLLGYPEPSNVYWFAKRFFGMSFNDFYRKMRKEI